MVFNVISEWYDLRDVLSVMIGCTATFIAIIGGLIANKAISDNAEKESIDKKLEQIDAEITINNKNIDELNEWLNKYNAKDFIQSNLESLLNGEQLSEFYDADDSNDIDFDAMLPYWNKALEAVKIFREAITSEKNNDGIPKKIISKLDEFQYKICSLYKNSIENARISPFENASVATASFRRVDYYNDTMDEMNELIKNNEILIAKEQLLQDRQDKINISRDIKGGMSIFAGVSIINIILPIIFMLFNPTSNKVWYYIETAISLITFSIGIITMIKYIYSLFPKKKTDIEETEPKNE